jgi:hypothetical protein
LGALTQTGVLPLVDNVKTAMQRKTKQAFLEANLKAFDLGFAAAQKAWFNERQDRFAGTCIRADPTSTDDLWRMKSMPTKSRAVKRKSKVLG